MTATANELFTPVERCWVCGAADLTPASTERIDYSNLKRRDPDFIAAYEAATR